MKGTLIGRVMHDARCVRPFDGGTIKVLIEGWDESIPVQTSNIKEVRCGKCDLRRGVERG